SLGFLCEESSAGFAGEVSSPSDQRCEACVGSLVSFAACAEQYDVELVAVPALSELALTSARLTIARAAIRIGVAPAFVRIAVHAEVAVASEPAAAVRVR